MAIDLVMVIQYAKRQFDIRGVAFYNETIRDDIGGAPCETDFVTIEGLSGVFYEDILAGFKNGKPINDSGDS